MDIRKTELLAEKIIQIDLIRDELYEELLEIAGDQAFEILRQVQNTKMQTQTKMSLKETFGLKFKENKEGNYAKST